MTTLSVLSYNLLFNKALNRLDAVLKEAKPDVLCVQEMETQEDNFQCLERHGYKLADYSNSFIKFGRVYGQVTFFNKKTVEFIASEVLNLPRSYYEIILLILRGVNDPRTVLKTDFSMKKGGARFVVYNLHLTSFQATNRARARQIEKTLSDLHPDRSRRIIVAGDFNYPYGRKRFERLVTSHELKEATSNLYFTSVFRFFKLVPIKFKTDYVLYRGLKLVATERVHATFSDHFPILTKFEL